MGGSGPVKFSGGGGDAVAHSSVWPPHGLPGAGVPMRPRRVWSAFQRNGSVDAPSRKAPIVEIWLRPVNPSLSK